MLCVDVLGLFYDDLINKGGVDGVWMFFSKVNVVWEFKVFVWFWCDICCVSDMLLGCDLV